MPNLIHESPEMVAAYNFAEFLAEITKPSALSLHWSSDEVTEKLEQMKRENGDE